MLEEYKKEDNTEFTKTIYLISIIKKYVKNIEEELTLETFGKI